MRLIPANDVPAPVAGANPVDGTHAIEVTEFGTAERAGKLCFDLAGEIIESANADDVGKRVRFGFWIGSDEDPQAEDPNTLKASDGFRIFAELLRATGMGNITDSDAFAVQLPGTKALVRVFTDKKGYLRAGNFYALGSQPLTVRGGTARSASALNGTGGHKATATPSGTPTPKPAAGQQFGRLVE